MLKFFMPSHILLGTALAIFTTIAAAETVYVSDTLRVGLRPEPGSSATPTGVVTTGMQLELLGQDGDYSQVRTEKGQTGWIKNLYIVNAPTAGIRIKSVEKKQAALKSQIKELKEANTVLATANHTLNQKVDTLTEERSHWQLEQARLQVNASANTGSASRWLWWLLGVLITAAAGFISGISWYRYSTSRRLGGLRV
ncbi:MAG: TIGR04211 family SH3 domain-containing protein [Proteobacteria bacterium]|nr:TIGR04211 family SH3 domain-containing protein [Pseudomonadota bacterium]